MKQNNAIVIGIYALLRNVLRHGYMFIYIPNHDKMYLTVLSEAIIADNGD